LGNDVDFVIATSADLAMTSGLLDAEIPLYALAGALLSVAALAEQVRVRSLEAYATCERMREVSQASAGLPDEQVLRYVRSVLATGKGPGPEAGAAPETEAGRWN
jgi:hypothetical protein